MPPSGGGVARPVGVGDATDEGVGFGVALAVGVPAGDGVAEEVLVVAGVAVAVGVGEGAPAITKISSSEADCPTAALALIW